MSSGTICYMELNCFRGEASCEENHSVENRCYIFFATFFAHSLPVFALQVCDRSYLF